MSSQQYALCVKLMDANAAQVVAAARKHKVAVLDIQNYNPIKDYTSVFNEYILDIEDAQVFLLFIFPNGESILSDEEEVEDAIERVNKMLLAD